MPNPKETNKQMRIIYDDGEIIDTSESQLEYWLDRRYSKSGKTPTEVLIYEVYDFEPLMNKIETENFKATEKHEKECRQREYEKLKKEFE